MPKNSNKVLIIMLGNSWINSQLPAQNWQFGFQKPAASTAEGIISFHDDLMVFLTMILFFVLYILWACLSRFTGKEKETERLVHASVLEIIWTIVPALILIVIAVPSFSLLYSVDEEVVDAFATFKVIGHQWYWSYHFLTPNIVKNFVSVGEKESVLDEWSTFFDSYMLSDDEIKELLEKKKESRSVITPYRLLTVDNFLYVPTEKNLRVLISSSDVLHSWAIPSLGIKVDACPGRLNRTNLFIKRQGVFYGQCSEICGVNHGFMPIGVIGLPFWEYNTKALGTFDWEILISAIQTISAE